jgi:hypothetical protein
MRIFQWNGLIFEHLVWRLLASMSRNLVKGEGAGAKDVAPQILSKTGIKDSPEGLKDGLIDPFRKAILLRGVGIRELLTYYMFSAIVA